MHLLLSGIVGSVAYGLAGPGSDTDRIGVFAAPTVAFHGRRRSAKHARHLARLLHQGRTLYATGVLEIRLADPEWFRAFGERVAGGALGEAQALVAAAEAEFDRVRSPLPERPDEETVERWLLAVRAAYLPR